MAGLRRARSVSLAWQARGVKLSYSCSMSEEAQSTRGELVREIGWLYAKLAQSSRANPPGTSHHIRAQLKQQIATLTKEFMAF